MIENDAIELIRKGVPDKPKSVAWVDLGCGNGTFTKALAQLLGTHSTLLAVDKENQRITSPNPDVEIKFLQADFTNALLPKNLDGALIANALHYVNDQEKFLQKISTHLNPGGSLIVIEYDTDRPNAWAPYPVTFHKLTKLLSKTDYQDAVKIGERNSVYNQNKMYACQAIKLK